MDRLANNHRQQLLEQLVVRSVPWLLRQQLPTGELVSYRDIDGYATPFACPLLSALALDALDCLDTSSPHFHERLFDLVPAAGRAQFRTIVSTLRWRLRLHLAASQSSNGCWRRFGLHGDSPFDLATTAFCYLMYLDKISRPQRDYATLTTQLSASQPDDLLGQIFTVRLLNLAGSCDAAVPTALFVRIESLSDPILPLWAIAQAHRQRALTLDPTQRAIMLHLALEQMTPSGVFGNRLHNVLGITILTVCDDGRPAIGAAVDQCIDTLLLDPQPPWLWPRDLLVYGASSAAVTLALALRSLAQAVLAPRELEIAPC